MEWYGDNSELMGKRGAAIPEVLIYGGIAISAADSIRMAESLQAVKAKYGDPRCPVKWNFKDLEKVYKRHNQLAMYSSLLASSSDWRREIVEESTKTNYTIIISCLEGYSLRRKILKLRKTTLSGYVFANCMMRLALHAQEHKATVVTVVSDWPDKGDSLPFDAEYASALSSGVSRDGVGYHAGPLSKLGFRDSVLYTNMNHCTLLQLADFVVGATVVGATREFIEYAIGKRTAGLGVDLIRSARHRFRGYPRRINGWGINIASDESEFRKDLRAAIEAELCVP